MRMFWLMALGIVAVCALVGIILTPLLPARMVTHWGIYGEPNGWMDTPVAILMLPAIMLAMATLLDFVPRLDPLHKDNEPFNAVYEQFIIVLLLFMASLQLTTIAWALGFAIPPFAVVCVGLTVLLIFIGRLCQSSRRNYFIGIRTPWALEDEENWKATNRIGASFYYWAAPLCLLGVLLPAFAIYFILSAALIPSLSAIIYSYWYYTQKKGKRKKERARINKRAGSKKRRRK